MGRRGAVVACVLTAIAAIAGVLLLLDPPPVVTPPPVAPSTVPPPPSPRPQHGPRNDDPKPLPQAPGGDGAAIGVLVRTGTGAPVRGKVTLAFRDGSSRSADAGEDGWFRVEGLPREEALRLEAAAPGMAAYSDPRVFVPLRGELDLGEIRLGEGIRLRCLVRDPAGRPIPGAAVSLHRPVGSSDRSDFFMAPRKPAAASTSTAGDGTAVLAPVSGGEWVLYASAEGCAEERRALHLAEGMAEDTLEVVLQRGFGLEGRVLDSEGRPVGGALLTALLSTSWWNDDAPRVTATADEEGRFTLAGLRSGHHQVSVRSHPGVQEFGLEVEVPAVRSVDIRLPPRTELRGTVVDDATGSPVEGAAVSLELWPIMDSGCQGFAEGRTNADGAFRFPDLPESRLGKLHVLASGYLSFPDSLTPKAEFGPLIAGGATTERAVRLHRGGVVRGTVRTVDGSPVPHAWIRLILWHPDHWYIYAPGVRSGADGAYEVAEVHPGRNHISAGARGLHARGLSSSLADAARKGEFPVECTVEVPATGTVEKDIVLFPDGRIEGRVILPDGTPAAGFVPRLVAVHEDYEEVRATGDPSAADGSFRLEEVLPGGAWVVTAEGPGGRKGRSEPIQVVEGGTRSGVTVPIPAAGSVSGRVRREDGTPLRGARVRLVHAVYDPETVFRWTWAFDESPPLSPSGDGTFRFEGVMPGKYTLSSSAEGCTEVRGPVVEIGAGEERTGVEVVLVPGLSLAGIVVSGDGKALAGASVSIWPSGERFHPGEDAVAAVTDAEGRFAKGGLSEGGYEIRVSAPGLPEASLTADAGKVDLRVEMGAGFSISGRVVEEESGRPAAGVRLQVIPDMRLSRRIFEEATTGEDGAFILGGLKEGEYQIMVGDTWGRSDSPYATRTVNSVRTGTANLVIRLERGYSIKGRVVDPEGNPISPGGMEVTLEAGGGEGGVFGTFTSGGLDSNGLFAFGGLRAGTYSITVGSRSFGEIRDTTWIATSLDKVVAGTEDLVVRLRRGAAISGRVIDEEGRAPVSTGRFGTPWLHMAYSDSDAEIPGTPIVKIDKDGSFRTPALEEGRTYTLSVDDGDLHAIARDVPAGAVGVVVRPEARTGNIAGRVLDDHDEPVPAGVPVRAEPVGGGRGAETETGDGGAFVLEGLAAVKHRVSAGGYPSDFSGPGEETIVEPGAPDVLLRVRRGCTLKGVVKEADGTPFEGILLVGYRKAGDYDEYVFGVEEDGTFEIKGLPAGEVVLKVQRHGVPMRFGEAPPEVGRFQLPCGEVVLTVPSPAEAGK